MGRACAHLTTLCDHAFPIRHSVTDNGLDDHTKQVLREAAGSDVKVKFYSKLRSMVANC